MSSIQSRNYSSLAAMTVLLCEWAVAVPFEVEWIWRKPITAVKCLYIYARCMGLTAQIVNYLSVVKLLSTYPVPQYRCKAWYTSLLSVGSSLLLVVDILLMLRLYALYNKSSKIAIFMATFAICQVILVSICVVHSMPHISFDPICNAKDIPLETYCFVSLEALIQIVIWTMMLKRRVVLCARSVGKIPLVELLLRDGTCVAAIICAIFFYNLPYTLHAETSNAHLIFVWPITFFSGAACRLVTNMYCSKVRLQPTLTEVNLTSVGITVDSNT